MTNPLDRAWDMLRIHGSFTVRRRYAPIAIIRRYVLKAILGATLLGAALIGLAIPVAMQLTLIL